MVGSELLDIALDFLAEYGLIAVFILLVLDGAMLMPVLPGEAVMIMAVTQYGHTLRDLVFLIVLTTVAGLLGSLILYTMARVGGRPLIEAHPRLFMMDRRRRKSLERTFEKPLGQSLVMFLRVIPLTRIIVNIPAGLARMGLGRFLVYTSIGMTAFHAGFLWLAYEYQQPESGVATQATQLQEAYGTPAWEYLQANEWIAILGAIVIGAYLSLKSSRRMLRYPEGAITSILGWLAVRLLVLGSVAAGVVVWYRPQLAVELSLAGGLDLVHFVELAGLGSVQALVYPLLGAWGLGVILLALELGAKRRRARANRRAKQREADRDAQAASEDEEDGEPEPSSGSETYFEDVSS